ncbi:hypothetical protein BDZ97DRAFT_1762158 [Flammula alnicola]|nr:hypothetical protein BDZ97DRAFT_1762158 [Flammula alnicola]
MFSYSQPGSLASWCLCPSPLCQFFVKKGKETNGSLKIDEKLSKGCLIKCLLCLKEDPAIWWYFLKGHFQSKHGAQLASKYEKLWTLSNFKQSEMQKIWIKKNKQPVKHMRKMKKIPLTVFKNHRAQIPSSNAVIAAIESDTSSDMDSDSGLQGNMFLST